MARAKPQSWQTTVGVEQEQILVREPGQGRLGFAALRMQACPRSLHSRKPADWFRIRRPLIRQLVLLATHSVHCCRQTTLPARRLEHGERGDLTPSPATRHYA